MKKSPYKHIVITGGAGFIGANIAKFLRKIFNNVRITVFDNLKRNGVFLNLNEFSKKKIDFIHGDVRLLEDIDQLNKFDLIIDASAEPSALAGVVGSISSRYCVNTNLLGTINCLEKAKSFNADVIFLSTSRVYPTSYILGLNYQNNKNRFDLKLKQSYAGVSKKGISEKFPIDAPRSLYGSTKLASEIMVLEYADLYNFNCVINRFGTVSGPGQMGKVEQGIVSLWVANHFYKKTLNYIGFKGEGKQVRDVLHVSDLCEAVLLDILHMKKLNGGVFNIGGGIQNSFSLKELTALCEKVTRNRIEIKKVIQESKVDIPYFVTDYSKFNSKTGWFPKKSLDNIVEDIWTWIQNNSRELKSFF